MPCEESRCTTQTLSSRTRPTGRITTDEREMDRSRSTTPHTHRRIYGRGPAWAGFTAVAAPGRGPTLSETCSATVERAKSRLQVGWADISGNMLQHSRSSTLHLFWTANAKTRMGHRPTHGNTTTSPGLNLPGQVTARMHCTILAREPRSSS